MDAVTFWESLPESVQESLKPCLDSKYIVEGHKQPVLRSPIYNDETMSFRRWLYNWCMHLKAYLTASNATSVNIFTCFIMASRLLEITLIPKRRVFNACQGVMLYDVPLTLFLLPYLVLFVTLDGRLQLFLG